MIKLKTILQSNELYALLLFILVIYLLLIFTLKNNISIYNGNETRFVGIVEDYTIKDNRISITLKGKEKLIVNYYSEIIPDIKYGDNITVYGILVEPSNNTIPNTFNYKKYLNNKNIYYLVKAKYVVINYRTNNVIYKLKNYIFNRIQDIDKKGYLYAFILGKKSYIDNYEDYQNIGVSHLFALSGMHVGFISLILLRTFKRFKYKYLLLYTILIVYSILTLFPASILRTIIFLIISNLNDYLKLEISNIKRLYLTGFILLISNYLLLLDISFIYSFMSVLGLITFFNNNNKNYLISMLLNGVSIFIFTLPISLYYFNSINLLSIVYNLIYIPLVSMIIYPFSLLVFIFPFLVFILDYLLKILELFTYYLNDISFLKIYMKINPIYLIIYYFILFLSIKYSKKILIILVILFIFIGCSFLVDSNNYIFFLDVGQGDSQLLITPYRREVILIDTGGNASNSNYHVSEKSIDFLHSLSINKINYLVLTHGDYDHMGEAINLVNNFNVEKVIFNCGPYNELEQELIKVLDKKKIKYYSCIKELDIDNNKLYFLQTKEYDNENDSSNVIYTDLNGYKFLFMGDAGIEKEKDILDKYNLQDIDVLKVGHHGSRTSSGKEFINEVNPRYSIISVGKKNRYGHPNKEVLDNLENSTIYRTDKDGSIMFQIKNNKLKIETCSP